MNVSLQAWEVGTKSLLQGQTLLVEDKHALMKRPKRNLMATKTESHLYMRGLSIVFQDWVHECAWRVVNGLTYLSMEQSLMCSNTKGRLQTYICMPNPGPSQRYFKYTNLAVFCSRHDRSVGVYGYMHGWPSRFKAACSIPCLGMQGRYCIHNYLPRWTLKKKPQAVTKNDATVWLSNPRFMFNLESPD